MFSSPAGSGVPDVRNRGHLRRVWAIVRSHIWLGFPTVGPAGLFGPPPARPAPLPQGDRQIWPGPPGRKKSRPPETRAGLGPHASPGHSLCKFLSQRHRPRFSPNGRTRDPGPDARPPSHCQSAIPATCLRHKRLVGHATMAPHFAQREPFNPTLPAPRGLFPLRHGPSGPCCARQYPGPGGIVLGPFTNPRASQQYAATRPRHPWHGPQANARAVLPG